MAHAQMTRAPATGDDVAASLADAISTEEKAAQPATGASSLAEGWVPGDADAETARSLTAETALTVHTNA